MGYMCPVLGTPYRVRGRCIGAWTVLDGYSNHEYKYLLVGIHIRLPHQGIVDLRSGVCAAQRHTLQRIERSGEGHRPACARHANHIRAVQPLNGRWLHGREAA